MLPRLRAGSHRRGFRRRIALADVLLGPRLDGRSSSRRRPGNELLNLEVTVEGFSGDVVKVCADGRGQSSLIITRPLPLPAEREILTVAKAPQHGCCKAQTVRRGSKGPDFEPIVLIVYCVCTAP